MDFKLPKLHWQILIGLILGILFGTQISLDTTFLGINLFDTVNLVGNLFLNALKMMVVPLIISTIIIGTARIAQEKDLGRLGGMTFTYYAITGAIAILVGLIVLNAVKPGIVNGEPAQHLLGLTELDESLLAGVEATSQAGFSHFLYRLLPPNIVQAANEGQLLGLIVFSLLFGYGTRHLKPSLRKTFLKFWEASFEVLMHITNIIIRFAPIGVFAFMAKVAATTGLDALRPLATFFSVIIVALGIHMFIILPLLLFIIGRVNPINHFKAMLPALLTAFSTSSSAATLPVTIECVKERAGVSNKVSSFVLPLGATINMDGTALYECGVVMFLAQLYGLDLSFTQQLTIAIAALLTSVGVAGIPSASLVAIIVILSYLGLPMEAVAIILAIDRPLDMARTAINVFSDSCGAVIIGRLEGEKNILTT